VSIVLTFSENMQSGTGNIQFQPADNANGASTVTLVDVQSSQVVVTGAIVTITPTLPLVDSGEKYFIVQCGGDALQDTEGNNFQKTAGATDDGLIFSSYHFTVKDTTAPSLATYSPLQGAQAQANSVDIVLTFNEKVAEGSGTIVLTPSGGNGANTPVSISVPTSDVVFSDYTVTISTGGLVDTGSKSYQVEVPFGTVKDLADNIFGGVDASTYSFHVADSTPPTIASYNPGEGVTGIAKGTNIVLTFSENIQAGIGNITVTPSEGNGPDIPIDIAVLSGVVTFSGTAVTIDPIDDLIDTGGKKHTVSVLAGVFKDAEGLDHPGASYEFTVADSTPPVATTFVPALSALNITKTADIVISFSEHVQADGSKDITLSPDTGSPVTIAADSNQVTISGKDVTINPSADLDATGMQYTITMPSGTFTDGVNSYAGLSGNTYRFVVQDTTAPTLQFTSPAHNSGDRSKGVNIQLTFSEPVFNGTGAITLTPSGGNGPNEVITIGLLSSDLTFNGNLVIIDPSADLPDQGGKTYTVAYPEGTFQDLERLTLGAPALGGTDYQFGVADSTPPLILTYVEDSATVWAVTPLVGSTDQPKETNITIAFSETVQAASGSVVLISSGGSGPNVVYSIDISSSEVAFNAGNISINPSNDLHDDGGKTYTVTLAPGVLKDASFNNGFAGISGTEFQFSVLDSTLPLITSFAPAQGATGLLKSVNIVLGFSEVVAAGSGSFTFTPTGGNGPNVPVVIDVSSGQVAFSEDQITINPTEDLVDTGTKQYTVHFPSGTVTDVSGNPHVGVNSTYEFTLADTTFPFITNFVPVQGATSVDKSTNLTITFSEHVQAGTGNILLTPDGGNGPHSPMAVDVTSGNVLFEGTSMSVDPPSDLTDTGEKNYTITFESGVVKDVSGNMYPGISGSTYTVLVADSTPPVVAAYYPVQNATDQPKSRSIVLTFSEDMIIGTGSIVITPSGGNGPDPVLYINVQSSQVSVSGTQVTIDPTDDLIDTGGKTHTVTFATGVLKDVKGNSFAGLFGDTYHFSVDDSTIPKLLSVTPVHGAVNQAKDSNIMLEFSEYVTAGVGKILLTPSGGNQANDQLSIWVNDSSQVTFNQRYATINPSNDLVDTGGKTYAVSMADGVIQGMGLNGFPGLNATAYTFAVTDSTPPAIVSYYPAANAEL